jgi:hypothetical protein
VSDAIEEMMAESEAHPGGAGDDPRVVPDGVTPETVRALRAEVARLEGEVSRRDAALAALGERIVPIEQARAEGAEGERARRQHAEDELRSLQGTRLYRLLLRPRAALYRRRQSSSSADSAP